MKKEKKIRNSPEPVNIAGTKAILEQMINCICKIKIREASGTGFFCKIPLGKNESLNVLMTNYHILDEKYYEDNKEIHLLLNDEKEAFAIDLLTERKTYFNKEYDITIIELKEEDGIKNFLELDDNLFQEKEKVFYEDKSIYVLQYPYGRNACVSYGLLINIEKNDIKHTCSTENGSSGSPILNLENNKVIAIHKGAGLSDFNFNKGTFLKYPLNNFMEEQNNDINESKKPIASINDFSANKNRENKNLSKEIYKNYEKNSYLIWIDSNIHNEKNTNYIKEIQSTFIMNIKLFTNVKEAINYIKEIRFKSTKVIISGNNLKIYNDFIDIFKKNIKDIYVAPKIILFMSNQEKKNINFNKEYLKKEFIFFTFGGIVTTIQEIKKFLNNEIAPKKRKSEKNEYIFEIIDKNEKLLLPINIKLSMESISTEEMENYTTFLYNIYSKDNYYIKQFLGQIESMQNIQLEILSKYYARFSTSNCYFYYDMNKDLKCNKFENYLTYIKVLYEGVKLKSLASDNSSILYRCSIISIDELKLMKNILMKKNESLPTSIVYSRSFLSFSKRKEIALRFLRHLQINDNLCNALFILEKNDNKDSNIAINCVMDNPNPNEDEILFFPFSFFEIREIKLIESSEEKYFEIILSYLNIKDFEKLLSKFGLNKK
jgi:V8-like Glu-specific endopeptidase